MSAGDETPGAAPLAMPMVAVPVTASNGEPRRSSPEAAMNPLADVAAVGEHSTGEESDREESNVDGSKDERIPLAAWSVNQLGPGDFPGLRRPFRSCWWCLKLLMGCSCLVVALAVLAAIPGLNILTLGYLVEPQRRVAVSGRLRDGFPLLCIASRLGTLVFFTLLFCIPIRIQATRLSDALVILGPAHPRTLQMQAILTGLQWLIGVHLLISILNGCTAGCFLRPLRNLKWLWKSLWTASGRMQFAAGLNAILDLLRPVPHFMMGLRAFFGAICWLIIPTSMLVAYSAPERRQPIFGLISFLGVLVMIPVAAWLPLLQVQQAVTGRFRSIFAFREVRRIICGAPWAWAGSTVILYAMTFPLYLGKIRLPPQDALLILTPFFILLTYPARILVAWAWHRGHSRPSAAGKFQRRAVKLLMFPLLAAYCGFLLLTPFVSELGRNAPFENQAFLGPVPYAQWRRVNGRSPRSTQPQQDHHDKDQIQGSADRERPEQTRPDSKDSVGQP
jgi:hypothetical protein